MATKNARNQLMEWLHSLGWEPTRATFTSTPTGPSGGHHCEAQVRLPDEQILTGSGDGHRKADAEIAASADLLRSISARAPELFVQWAVIKSDAQAGDVLLKLAGYLAADLTEASERSWWLQTHESDKRLAAVFDQWHAARDPDLAVFGPKLGCKRKATLVEAFLWRRHRDEVLASGAIEQLRSMLESLNVGRGPAPLSEQT